MGMLFGQFSGARPRVALTLALGLAVVVAVPGATSATGSAASCRQVAFSVQTLGGQHLIRGTLCRPSDGSTPRAALVLAHGATYNRTYWDFPLNPVRYSALRILAQAGYLTLAIDQLGSGDSDRPPSDQVTADVSADTLHQVISQLRADPATHTRLGKVFVVGHSAGSVVAIREAAQFDDIDGIVVTGFLHAFGPGSGLFTPMIHPAVDDAKFQNDSSIPAGYVTTQPGVRFVFYYPFNAEERVVNADDQAKDAMPGGDPTGFLEETLNATFARQLHIPVLDLIGTHDHLFCTPPDCPQAGNEPSFYAASPDFQIITRPRTGHDLNLHLNAAETTDLIRGWADRHALLS